LWNAQETPSVICGDLFEKVQLGICCTDELAIDPHAVITLFLHHHPWYDVLADMMHLQILTEDVVATTN
jgi:hypothetical protein